MAQAIVQLPPDSTGKMIAARSYTEGANTVYAQGGYLATDAPVSTASITTATGTATATGLATMTGNCTITVHGTYGFTATPPTYILEGSDDTGTTWYAITAIREDTGMQEQTGTLAANTSRTWNVSVPGYDSIRIRMTAWGTPTGTISVKFSPGGTLFEPPASHVPNQRVQFQCIVANDTMTTTDAVRTTLVATRDFIASAAAASIAVTAGKRLRLTAWTMTVKAPSTTAVGGQYTLRVNPTGVAVVGSPAVAIIAAGLTGTQVAQTATSNSLAFPDGGIELVGPMQFTVSGIGVASAGYSLSIQGYEY